MYKIINGSVLVYGSSNINYKSTGYSNSGILIKIGT